MLCRRPFSIAKRLFSSGRQYNYDLVVIGAGSGGVACARRAAKYGAKVAIVENSRVGGTCVNLGCIPKKILQTATVLGHEMEVSREYGWQFEPNGVKFDWAALMNNKDKEIERLNGIYTRLLQNSGVDLIQAKGYVDDAHHVRLTGRQNARSSMIISTERILLAMGSYPFVPRIPGWEHVMVSDDFFSMKKLPSSIAVIGGGYIGTELACILNAAISSSSSSSPSSSAVVQFVRGDSILREWDGDLVSDLTKIMRGRGIAIETQADIKEISKLPNGHLELVISQKGSEKKQAFERVLYATGRRPNTRGIGLEINGIYMKPNGAVLVNEDYQTSVPSIYAIGDCTDRLNLTPVAIAEGRALAENWFNGKKIKVNYQSVPTAVFSQPEVASVGLTEEAARTKFSNAIDIYRTRFRPMKYAMGNLPPSVSHQIMMKIVVHRETQKVLGCHMLGPNAAEMIQLLGVVVANGLTKQQLDQTVALHPTMAEEWVLLPDPVPSK